MTRHSIQIDGKTRDKLKRLAKSKDRTMAQEIRELVNEELEREEIKK